MFHASNDLSFVNWKSLSSELQQFKVFPNFDSVYSSFKVRLRYIYFWQLMHIKDEYE